MINVFNPIPLASFINVSSRERERERDCREKYLEHLPREARRLSWDRRSFGPRWQQRSGDCSGAGATCWAFAYKDRWRGNPGVAVGQDQDVGG